MIVIRPAPNVDMVEAARLRSASFELISIKRAAELLGISLRTARYWQAAGKMPGRLKHGHRLMYRRADIEAVRLMLAAKCV